MAWSKAKTRAYKKAWDKANKERKNEYQREWRKANPERTKELAKTWRDNNKDHIREYRLANPEKIKKARITRTKKINENFDVFVKHKITKQKAGAKRRNLAWNLSDTQVYNLFLKQKTCRLTGVKVTYKIGDPNQASLDRIDNRYGYSIKNVQVTTSAANKSRMDMTMKEWDKMCVGRAKQLGYTRGK